MKFKITSILFACAFLMLASCGDSSDSDKKDDSSEQAEIKKQNHIKQLMAEYTDAADVLLVMLEKEQENDDKVQELYEQYIETSDEVLSSAIDTQIENFEALGDELSEKVMDLLDPLKVKEREIDKMFEDLSAEQQKSFNSIRDKFKIAFSR